MNLSIFRQTWELIRQNRLFTGIYIMGTALAVAMVTSYAITYYVQIAPIYPEYERGRTASIKSAQWKSERGMTVSGVGYGVIKDHLSGLENKELITCVYDDWSSKREATSTDLGIRVQTTRRYTDPNFFKLYNFNFAEGAPFTDAQFESAEAVAVIGDNLARQLFGDSQKAIGSEFLLEYKPFRVVGVVEQGSNLNKASYGDIFIPYTVADDYKNEDISGGWVGSFDVYFLTDDFEALQDEVSELERRTNSSRSPEDGEVSFPYGVKNTYLEVFQLGYSEGTFSWWNVVKSLGLILLVLLLVPALNLSGLIASRMDNRVAEMGVRKSFGATPGRLLRRVMTENLILTCIGGVAGLILTWLIISLSANWLFGVLSGKVFFEVDYNSATTIVPSMIFAPAVFGISFLVCLVLNVISALIPAWRSLRRPIVNSLKEKI